MDHEMRESLRIALGMLIGSLPWKLLNGNERIRRGDQYQRQDELLNLILARLEAGYEIRPKFADNPFPGHHKS